MFRSFASSALVCHRSHRWFPVVITCAPKPKRVFASSSDTPFPSVTFSPFTTQKSTSYFCRYVFRSFSTSCRPGLPTISPTKKIFRRFDKECLPSALRMQYKEKRGGKWIEKTTTTMFSKIFVPLPQDYAIESNSTALIPWQSHNPALRD